MKTTVLIHNAIVAGKFYFASEPIEEAILPREENRESGTKFDISLEPSLSSG
jgi:hypothetical protein